jgi:ABC-type Zn uptake system ZnuABC Zn-binding protein ZnuA
MMNERIKKLAEQALKEFMDKHEYATVIVPDSLSQKFAELIVKECAAEADKQTIYCRGIPWGRWIKEHFGVE